MIDRSVRFFAVIPAFNEAKTIRAVVTGTLRHVHDVVVVDDGSTDGTAAALADLPVTVLRAERNEGKAAALWRGAAHAMARGANALVTLDGDGQHDPADIPGLLAAYRRAPGTLVVGSRLHARDIIPVARYRANRFANFWIAWAAGCPISDSQSGFRVYPAAVFALPVRHGRWSSFVFESEVLIAAARAGFPVLCSPISVRYADPARPSHLRPVVDIGKIVIMVAGRLLATGMNVPGLVRSLRGRRNERCDPSETRQP